MGNAQNDGGKQEGSDNSRATKPRRPPKRMPPVTTHEEDEPVEQINLVRLANAIALDVVEYRRLQPKPLRNRKNKPDE